MLLMSESEMQVFEALEEQPLGIPRESLALIAPLIAAAIDAARFADVSTGHHASWEAALRALRGLEPWPGAWRGPEPEPDRSEQEPED